VFCIVDMMHNICACLRARTCAMQNTCAHDAQHRRTPANTCVRARRRRAQVFCIVVMCIAGALFGGIIGELQARSFGRGGLRVLALTISPAILF
jgi:hypothetical protein